MTSLAPTLEAYFTDRLIRQRRASPHTIASYRDTFRLLLAYLQRTTGTPPSRLEITDLDAATIGAFLQHLEQERENTARTRNIRLSAIHSFFHYCALRPPSTPPSFNGSWRSRANAPRNAPSERKGSRR